jgi:hypothetical protein
MTASTETVEDIEVTNGTLNLTVTPREGETLLSGIEVLKTAD